jgi:hypothetical protein
MYTSHVIKPATVSDCYIQPYPCRVKDRHSFLCMLSTYPHVHKSKTRPTVTARVSCQLRRLVTLVTEVFGSFSSSRPRVAPPPPRCLACAITEQHYTDANHHRAAVSDNSEAAIFHCTCSTNNLVQYRSYVSLCRYQRRFQVCPITDTGRV